MENRRLQSKVMPKYPVLTTLNAKIRHLVDISVKVLGYRGISRYG